MSTALACDLDLLQQPTPDELSVLPPRFDCGQHLGNETIWATASDWVATHRKTILKAGHFVVRAGWMENDDLLQTAHIIAVEQCRRVLREGQLENFVPLFFSHLRGHCQGEWQRRNHEATVELDWEKIPDPHPVDVVAVCDGIDPHAQTEAALVESFACMTEQQERVMRLLLGMEQGRGAASLREAAAWFELRSHTTVLEVVSAACQRVAKGKLRPVNRQQQQTDDPTLHRQLAALQARYDALLADNLSLRRQLGRPAING